MHRTTSSRRRESPAQGPRPLPVRQSPAGGVDDPLPHNPEAELAVLGAIVLDGRVPNGALATASQKVTSADFFFPRHRLIFDRMVELNDEQAPIGMITLIDQLEKSGGLEAAGGAAFVGQLGDGLPRVTDVSHYAQIIKEKAKLRSAISSAAVIQERALDPGAKLSDITPCVEDLSRILAPEQDTRQQEILLSDMPDDVLDGALGEICDRRLVGLPRAYSWPALLCSAGVLVPPTPHVRTNLYACLVGGVGTGKSVAGKRATDVLGLGKPQLETTLAGSAEGLLEKISDANGAARLLSPDELGHLLTKARIDCASFPYVLNSAFYQNEFDLTVARGKQIHVNVALSVLGGIVEENFELCFGSATTGGLHDRFVFGLCPRPFNYLYRPLEGAPEITEPCSVTVAPDVWEARDEWIRTIPGLGHRCAEHAVRAAVIGAAFSGRTVLLAKHLGPARAFAVYQASVRKMLKPNPGENPDARCAFAILGALDQDGDTWQLKRKIAKKIHAERFGPSVFERAVAALEKAGELILDRQKPMRIRRIGPR